MDDKKLLRTIENLISEGEKFTFDNYSSHTRSPGGNSMSYKHKPSWIIWINRIKKILEENLNKEAAPFIYHSEAILKDRPKLYKYEFNNMKLAYINSLKAFKTIISDSDPFDELKIALKNENTNPSTEPRLKTSKENQGNKSKIFIVHGHDHNLKVELEIFISRLGLTPIVLHREVDSGLTIIEKFEKNSDVEYVFILMTPDEISFTVDQKELPEEKRKIEYRARPNVVFEFGYFVGKLGRNKVCVLHKGNVNLPSDINGFIYKKVDKSIEEIGFALIKEMKSVGIQIKI